jgi:2-oxoglutarate dehydrogenase E2 component (dihydrolipoamide succinyltransferase)
MGFRVNALRGRFREADLAGGNIGLALSDETDVVSAQPLILPPHACMLALCAPQEELRLDDAGRVTVRRYLHLGLAYDHRVINGRDATLFLAELKRRLEGREHLLSLAPTPSEPHAAR